ncbi:MAG: protein kinase, partial [Planctomycetota bacterium]
ALDPSLNRYVAIKALLPAYAGTVLARKRFEREGRAIAAVRNRHVIEIHGVDMHQSTPFIVMQYLSGGSLQKRIHDQGCLSTLEVCRIGMQIADGLAGAHHQGIIHRDIKPANILMEQEVDQAIVTDFGLARVADESSMTQSGMIAGTPEYMSPEQACGDSLDVRSDLFSLGCVMYAACTGHSPFRAETLMGVIHNVREKQAKPILESNPEIAEWLAVFIDKLLEKDGQQRFGTAAEVSSLLAKELAYLQTPTISPIPERDWWQQQKPGHRRWLWGGLSIGVMAIVALLCCMFAFYSDNKENKYGIEPTRQEANFREAFVAYDMACQTHLRESEERGDMMDSIAVHNRAYALGFNKEESAFYLARAYAIQKNRQDALAWLETAVEAGFRDAVKLRSEPELDLIRQSPKFGQLMERVIEMSTKHARAKEIYFSDANYTAAEEMYRQLLRTCPNDDHSVLMLGASLLEQGKFEEAEVWSKRTRRTVRYSGYGNYNLGCIAAQRGDFDTAFAYLNYAAETGFADADHLEKDHHTRVLRSDVRFQKVLQRYREKANVLRVRMKD